MFTLPRRYLVTGATGFVGGAVARQLREAGHAVVCLVRSPDRADALRDIGCEVVQGDITDRESLTTPMTGVDGVFHLAAWYELGAKDSSLAQAINVQGTRNVLETMALLGVPKGVYTSTLAVFSDTHGELVSETYRHEGAHLSVYDETKARAHYDVAVPMIAEGLPLVIVQPGVVYGPGDHSAIHGLWQQLIKRSLPAAPRGVAYCWAHVDDVATAHMLAMDKGLVGETYIIAGERVSLAEALQTAATLAGVPAPTRTVPVGLLRAASKAMGVLNAVLPLSGTLHPETLRVMAGATYLGDNTKARQDLGYAPRPLAEGLVDTLRWELTQAGLPTDALPST